MMKIAIVAFLIVFGSTHAAKKSQTEVVSFINDNKQFICIGNNVEWYFPNDSQIIQSSEKFQIEKSNGKNESVLTVKKINVAFLGVYKCRSDQVEEEFDLKLYYPLSIDYFNRLQTVQENHNVTLKCKVMSIPNVEKITWYHEDKELVPEVDYESVRDGILLKNVQRNHAGKYSCIAVQKIGTVKNVQQRDMELIVEYGPRPINSDPIEIYGKIGETHSLNCEAKCQPTPVFKWLINGYETYENINIRDSTSTLEVKIDSIDDFQNYTCFVSNIHGQMYQTYLLKERLDVEESTSKTSSKTVGVISYTIMMLIITFIIY